MQELDFYTEIQSKKGKMTKTPDIWDLSDEQITEELGRMGWVRDASWATKEESELALTQEALRRILKLLIKGATKQMQISKVEMETILVMYKIVCAEGQELDFMVNLVERIKKEKGGSIHRQTEDEWLEENPGVGKEL